MTTAGNAATEACGLRGRRPSPWVLAWLAFLPALVVRAGTLAESDTFWAVRTGLVTLSTGEIPPTDPFSWTAAGDPWTLNSWGFNVLLALAYRVAGLAGVALLGASICAVVGWLVLLLARRLGASPVAAGSALLVAWAPLAVYLSARPQVVDYAATLALVLLLRDLLTGRLAGPWAVAAVGVLSVVWVNLHAAVLLGVAVTGGATLLAAVRPETRAKVGWSGAALAVAVAGSLLNPYGVGVLTQGSQVAAASAGIITEWRPIDPTSPLQVSLFVPGLVALVLAARRRDVVLVAALAVASAMSVAAMRFLPVLLLVALPVLAAALDAPAVRRYARSRRTMLTRGAVFGLSVLTVLAAQSATHLGRPDPALYPSRVHEAVPAGCRLFNGYLLGGFLILERPDVPVSLDSRNDLYGTRHVAAASRTLEGRGDVQAALAGVDCVLVPASSGLADRLRSDRGWVVEAEEPAAVLFLRR